MMRSGFLVLCSLLAIRVPLFGQGVEPPVVVRQPESVTAYLGESASISATISGTAPLALQWFRNSTPVAGATTSTLAGATTATYSVPVVSDFDMGVYYLTATNTGGTVTTTGAAIYVTKRPQTITFTVTSPIAAGSGVTLNATSSANLPITYTILGGAATLSGKVLTGTSGNVTVRASQPGTATIAAAEPVDRTILFVAGALSPFITSPPVDQIVNAGTPATIRASAIGTPAPTYQWQKDGVVIPGATDGALTIANPTLADTGRYTATATNMAGTATASATLTVRAAPVFTTMPQSQDVFAGSPVTFTVEMTGVPTPTLQWRKNGTAIAGATTSTLRIASTAAADAARYEAVATNLLGATTSAPAVLTVTTRDFSGTYFGQLSGTTGAAGDFALTVRANRSAVFLGYLPNPATAVTVLDLTLDGTGQFTGRATLGTQTITLTGTVDEATGRVTGSLTPTISFDGARTTGDDRAAERAGVYYAGLLGSASGRGYIAVAPDGQAFVLTAAGTAADAGRGAIGSNGRLALTTRSQAQLDFGFANQTISGTVRSGTAPNVSTGTILGALSTALGGEHLVNLSVRSTTNGANPLIAGFVISGTGNKQVMVRVAGPAIGQAPFNVQNVVNNPTLQVLRGSTVVGQNDDWSNPAINRTAVAAAIPRVGAFPFQNNSNDAALVGTLQPAAYTVVIGGGNGTVLAEVYEVLETSEVVGVRRLVNLSARGIVAPGSPLIAGFVVAGVGPQRVLIRGIGPALSAAPFNVQGALPNPLLTLFRGTTAIKTSDDWFRDPEATVIRDASVKAAAFALGAQSADASMLTYLEPGAYTAQVSGPANGNANNGTGIALIEVYESNP